MVLAAIGQPHNDGNVGFQVLRSPTYEYISKETVARMSYPRRIELAMYVGLGFTGTGSPANNAATHRPYVATADANDVDPTTLESPGRHPGSAAEYVSAPKISSVAVAEQVPLRSAPKVAARPPAESIGWNGSSGDGGSHVFSRAAGRSTRDHRRTRPRSRTAGWCDCALA